MSFDFRKFCPFLSRFRCPCSKTLAITETIVVFRIIKFMSILILTIIGTYLIAQELHDFADYPIASYTTVYQNGFVKFPRIVLCRKNFNTANFNSLAKDFINKKCQQYEDCKGKNNRQLRYHPLKQLDLNLDNLWDELGLDPVKVDHEIYCPYVKDTTKCSGSQAPLEMKKIKTIFGTCVDIFLNELFYFHEYWTYIIFHIKYNEQLWLYIPNSDNYSVYEIFYNVEAIPLKKPMEVLIMEQNFEWLNTEKNPCTDEFLSKCKNQCVEKILRSKMKCSLPILNPQNTSLPECSNLDEIVKAYGVAYNIFPDMIYDKCECVRQCSEKDITSVTTYGRNFYGDQDHSHIELHFASNLITTTTEDYLYPVPVLLSSIGGCIGLFLGIFFFIRFLISAAIYCLKNQSGNYEQTV